MNELLFLLQKFDLNLSALASLACLLYELTFFPFLKDGENHCGGSPGYVEGQEVVG